jgi:hypothetical protein
MLPRVMPDATTACLRMGRATEPTRNIERGLEEDRESVRNTPRSVMYKSVNCRGAITAARKGASLRRCFQEALRAALLRYHFKRRRPVVWVSAIKVLQNMVAMTKMT